MSKLGYKVGDMVRRTGGPEDNFKPGDKAVVVGLIPAIDGAILVSPGRILSPARYWELDRPQPSKNLLLLIGVRELITLITYKPGWTIEAHEDDAQKVYVQLSVNAFAEASMDSAKRDGTRSPWKSAKRYLSPHMCKQELVGVVFDLIKSAELHEVHEWFRYKGASIYNPHLDPDALAMLARKKESFVVRENAMSMVEEAA